MRVIVDEGTCTGCGACGETCPEVFELRDKIARVKVYPVPPEHEGSCRKAAEGCPVDAIKIKK